MKTMILAVTILMLMGGCASKMSNAQKCQSIGGSYSVSTRNCQLQAE